MSRLRGTTVLITGGRAPVALDLARKFAACGSRVLVAESAPADLCRRSKAVAATFRVPPPNRAPGAFAEALAGIAKREAVDLLVPTCEEIFWVARALDVLEPHCRVLAEPLERLRGLHSKWEFVRQAEAFGLPVPRTVRGAGLRLPYVVKPVFSRFATKVRVVTAEEPAPDEAWVAQELLTGRQVCTYSVAAAGRLVAHAAYEVEFTASGACVNFAPIDDHPIEQWVTKFLEKSGFTGQIAFDFIDGLPLECNPRATSGIHLFGPELAEVLYGCATGVLPGQPLRPDPERRAMLGLAMLGFGLGQHGLARWWRVLRESADVIAVPGDRGPFRSQLDVLWHTWLRSLWTRRSMIECSTYDIQWDGR
ncbi:hypothetical protein [Nonomuraea sp. NPDC050310]|uniref:hypothetical protein n=1 Tax=Nonomuraea sp. NPDC050310 TaxID=3154935 RepID=UPI0033D1B08D